MELAVAKVLQVLQKNLHSAEELRGGNPHDERSIRVTDKQFNVLIRSITKKESRRACAIIIANTGFPIIYNIMIQSKLAAPSLTLIRILSSVSYELARAVFTSGLIRRAVDICQRSACKSLHRAMIELLCNLAMEVEFCCSSGPESCSVPDAILLLLNTQCAQCKDTAMNSLSKISLDSASIRNLFVFSTSAVQPCPDDHWTKQLLPQLFRLAVDQSRVEAQYLAAELIVLLAPLPGNTRLVFAAIATWFSIPCFDNGQAFYDLCRSRWKVKSNAPGALLPSSIVGSVSASGSSSAHSLQDSVALTSYLLRRVLETIDGDPERLHMLRRLHQAEVHLSMLLFTLFIVDATKRDNAVLTSRERECAQAMRAAQASAVGVLQTLARMNAPIQLELYELFALHRLPVVEADGGIDLQETVRSPEFVSSLSCQVLLAKLRVESQIATNIEWLRGMLETAVSSDSKGHPALLEMSYEDLQRERGAGAGAEGNPSEPLETGKADKRYKLGYKQLASLFDISKENPSVSEARLEMELGRLMGRPAVKGASLNAKPPASTPPTAVAKKPKSQKSKATVASVASAPPTVAAPVPPLRDSSKPSPRGAWLRLAPAAPPPTTEADLEMGQRFIHGGISLEVLSILAESKSLAFITQLEK